MPPEERPTALHPQCEHVLRIVSGWGDLPAMTVAQARALELRRRRELGGAPEPVADVGTVRIAPGLRARVYRPLDGSSGVLVWLHGGGWVLGSPDLSDDQTRALANASGCTVVSVHYRLAPEHPFPAGLEDCYAAVAWAAERVEEFGEVAPRLAVGGDSAGGNLTAAVTLLARERGGPRIDAQLLVYPVTAHAPGTPSYALFADGRWLTADAMAWFWERYLPLGADPSNPLISPLRADSLAVLPPAIVATAEHDVLRDEGERYAARLRDAGVPVLLRRYDGMLHGFLACMGVVDGARTAIDELGREVAAALARDPVGAPG